MKTVIILMVVSAAVLIAAVAAQFYLRFASESIRTSYTAWDRLMGVAQKIVTDESYPPPVRDFAYGLAMSTGCGCYVRAFTLLHLRGGRESASSKQEKARGLTEAMATLTRAQRAAVREVILQSIIFDGLANPLQGWAFTKIVRQPRKGTAVNLSPELTQEAKAATIKVFARRQRVQELCTA